MRDDRIWRLDAVAQAELVRRGEVTPLELVDGAIERIERTHDALNAVILPAFDRARDAARRLRPHTRDAAGTIPAFLGVPLLMKDLGGQEGGAPFHMGIGGLKRIDWRAPTDSYTAARLRAAGFVSLGRTNTPELGLLPTSEPVAYGPTRNPWDPTRSPGGSSGGSAAAVASGLVPVAHASDGGGSIRIPAAHCGLVGLKPTRGRVSFGPLAGERWAGFSCELVVSRSVRDTAAVLDVLALPMPGDPYFPPPPARRFAELATQTPPALRIGVLTHAPRSGIGVDPACRAAALRAARLLEELGHRVEEASPGALADEDATRTFVTVVACNIARTLDAIERLTGKALAAMDVEPLTWAVAELGRATAAPRYIAAVDAAHEFGRKLAAWWEEGFDLLLTPTTGEPPPPLGQFPSTSEEPFLGFTRAAPFGAFTTAFNMSGQPAISVPLHWTAEGLPVGAQLAAGYGREDLLLQVAAQIERAAPWADRWPPIAGKTVTGN
ncbi:amidase [Candidatus Binatia bacterium]|nr:amidase [Candidatus Binatia bacterium]